MRLPISTCHDTLHGTEPSQTNLSRGVERFRDGVTNLRQKGPAEPSQREVRRTLAQSRPPAAPRRSEKAAQTQFVVRRFLPDHTVTDSLMTSLRGSIALCPLLLFEWSFGAAPATRNIPTEMASRPVPEEIFFPWPWCPGEDVPRHSPRSLLMGPR